MTEPVEQRGSGRPKRLGGSLPADLVVSQKAREEIDGVHAGRHLLHVNEPELKVKPESSQALSKLSDTLRSVPDSKDDDRGEAVNWFIQMRITHALQTGKLTRAQIKKHMGFGKGHLSQIESAKLGIKFKYFIRFAELFGEEPGAMLTEALNWWPTHGRKYRASVLQQRARGASESGEHQAVQDQAGSKKQKKAVG